MLETARIIGFVSAVLLLAAIGAWAKAIWTLLPQRLDGRALLDSKQAKFASELLFFAVGLSAVAAFLAVSAHFVGWVK